MAAQGFAMFDTAFGRCAIAWSTRGITGVQLPERDDATTRARLLTRAHAKRYRRPRSLGQSMPSLR
jgi:methylated-DNA-[protein]-cysteine S-methyltransferase